MAEKSRTTTRHRSVSERVRDAETMAVDLPVIGHIRIPHPERLAFYGALAALAAVQIIEWPIAVILAVGHALAENEHSRVAREVGEALDDV